jgi:hypothetical protein
LWWLGEDRPYGVKVHLRSPWLLGEDDHLHPVAEPQLGQDAAVEVRALTVARWRYSLRGDPGVGPSLGQQAQHLQLPLGEAIQLR